MILLIIILVLLVIIAISYCCNLIYETIERKAVEKYRKALVENFGDHYLNSDINESVAQLRIQLDKIIHETKQKYSDLTLEREKQFNKLSLERQQQYSDFCLQKEQEYDNLIESYKNKHKEFDQCVLLLKTKSAKFPPLARAIAKMKELEFDRLQSRLSVRAYNASEIVREAKRKSKEYILKFYAAKNLIDSYEALFPWLEEYRTFDIDNISIEDITIPDGCNDVVLKYVSFVDYSKLKPVERNQLALDRYISGHKSNIQLGRLYERYIGYLHEKKGYEVFYTGALNCLEDLGRDLIAKKNNEVLIIQCKYWSKEKTIRENTICQLYGTGIKYKIEHKKEKVNVQTVLMTSTSCSDMAKEFAEVLGVKLNDNFKYHDYPMIKCNIGKNNEKIYHLPMDQMYDKVKIEPRKGEFYAMTCMEAELNGFRRAYKWNGNE